MLTMMVESSDQSKNDSPKYFNSYAYNSKQRREERRQSSYTLSLENGEGKDANAETSSPEKYFVVDMEGVYKEGLGKRYEQTMKRIVERKARLRRTAPQSRTNSFSSSELSDVAFSDEDVTDDSGIFVTNDGTRLVRRKQRRVMSRLRRAAADRQKRLRNPSSTFDKSWFQKFLKMLLTLTGVAGAVLIVALFLGATIDETDEGIPVFGVEEAIATVPEIICYEHYPSGKSLRLWIRRGLIQTSKYDAKVVLLIICYVF